MNEVVSSRTTSSSVTRGESVVSSNQKIENIILVWFDLKIEECAGTQAAMQQLYEINDDFQFYTDLELCLEYLCSTDNDKIFLITSGACALELVPRIHSLRQIDSIFIYCIQIDNYQDLSNQYQKVVDVYTTMGSLCTAIREEADLLYKQMETFTFFNQNQKAIKDLSKQAAEFLWFQLFTYIILHLPRDDQAKRQMIDICRHYYRNNPKQLQLIDEFETSYRPEDAIRWYTKQCFLYKLVNKALRSEDIDQLHAFRFFISDLSKILVEEHNKLLNSTIETLVVYRGVKISIEELNRLKENQGKLISTNGFLSTSQNRTKALKFALKSTKRTDVVPILFEIKCNIQQLGDSVILANIAELSEYVDEEEVLFDLGATFKLETIVQNRTVWLIKMSASADGQNIVKRYIEITRQETEEKSVSIMFGRLMCDMGQYDKSRQYFEQLLLSDSDSENRASIELNIGRALYHKGEWELAKGYYERAYEQMMNADPPRIKESAYALNSIGNYFQRQRKYDEARNYFEQALDIRAQCYPADHPNIAQSLHSIGNILDDQGKYDDALNYYRKALQMRKRYYPAGHPHIACSLNDIALVLKKQGKYKKALDFYQQARTIYEEYYPTDHPNIATSLYNIATILEIQGQCKDALELYQRALKIYEQCYGSEHPDVIATDHAIRLLSRHSTN